MIVYGADLLRNVTCIIWLTVENKLQAVVIGYT